MAAGSGNPDQRVIAWLSPTQAGLIDGARARLGFDLVGVGCPEKGKSGAVAGELTTEPVSDLRAALASADVDLILIASPGEFGSGGSQDAGAIEAARARGVTVVTLEAIPPTALELGSSGWLKSNHGVRPIDALRLAPRMRTGRAMSLAADAFESFGRARVLHIESLCRPEHATLGARLLDAMDAVHALMGMPESIDAAYVGPAAAGLHSQAGDSLRDLRGDLTINLRFSDGRAACTLASDQAPRWERSVGLLGEQGRLVVDESGLAWTNTEGEVFDTQSVELTKSERTSDASVIALADSIGALMGAGPAPEPTDHEALLAMAQAVLLSARTGQSESPEMFRRLVVGA